MKLSNKFLIFSFTIIFISLSIFVSITKADDLLDSDKDGYSDEIEIKTGHSPYNPENIDIKKSDVDGDGLSDYFEIKYKTDPYNPDSDADGIKDGVEIDFAYDPLSTSTIKLSQNIKINTKEQKLTYYVAGVAWKEFTVSTGKPSMPTPKGDFKIVNKSKKAWSNTYKLWMPFWLGLDRGRIGIHELPVWPSGYREGESHLGKAVSHGCVRLGIGAAEYLFNRVDVGTQVTIE